MRTYARAPSMTQRPSFAPQLWLLSMNLIWGASYSAVKYSLDRGLQPFALMTARFWLACLCLLPLVAMRERDRIAGSAARGLVTGLALLLGYVLQTYGMQQTTASMAGFLSGLITLLVALGGWLVFRERLHGSTALGLLLGFAGLVMMCWGAEAEGSERKDTIAGILMQTGAAVSFACHILLMSRWSRTGEEFAFCWWQLVAVAIGATVALPLSGGAHGAMSLLSDPWIAANIVYLAVFALAIALVVQSRMQPRIKATQVAVIFATQPLFGALGGMGLLGDTFDTQEWIGAAMITGGVLLAELLRPRSPAHQG